MEASTHGETRESREPRNEAGTAGDSRPYPTRWLRSLQNLLAAKDSLLPRQIRPGAWRAFLAFPLAMTFINVQDLVLDDGQRLFGHSHTTVAFLAFIAGAICLFALSNEKRLPAVSGLSAVLTLCGMLPWMFLPAGTASVAFSLIMMAGLGGCVSSGSFHYVFSLNNAERFYGGALMVLLVKAVEWAETFTVMPPAVRKSLAVGMLLGVCASLLPFGKRSVSDSDTDSVREAQGRREMESLSSPALLPIPDFSSETHRPATPAIRDAKHTDPAIRDAKHTDPAIPLTLYLFLSYFAIRITGFYAPSFQHPAGASAWGLLALALMMASVLSQIVLRRSVWTLCNVFFLSSVLAHVMWYAGFPNAAFLFSEWKEIGLVVSLYLVGCVTNRFCDFRAHKRLLMLSMAACGMLYAGIDFLHTRMPTQTLATLTAALLFIVFLMLSPSYSQHLFFSGWSKAFRLVHMTSDGVPRTSDSAAGVGKSGANGPSDRKDDSRAGTPVARAVRPAEHPGLDDTSLTPREKQVVVLLLRGMTLRQVAPELGLSFSTVSTYSRTIYRKLGINSRAELFILFGGPLASLSGVSGESDQV